MYNIVHFKLASLFRNTPSSEHERYKPFLIKARGTRGLVTLARWFQHMNY